jgi:hypothetical protein
MTTVRLVVDSALLQYLLWELAERGQQRRESGGVPDRRPRQAVSGLLAAEVLLFVRLWSIGRDSRDSPPDGNRSRRGRRAPEPTV